MDRIDDRAGFASCVFLGKELLDVFDIVPAERRDAYDDLERFLSDSSGRVCMLYGIRGSGITTLTGQAVCSMTPEDLARTAVLDATGVPSMRDVFADLDRLEGRGYRNVFINEITSVDGFIRLCGPLSTVYAASGMRIVLSGTDTLALRLACDDGLYGRTDVIHLDPVPFREHARLYPSDGIDGFIVHGGTVRGDSSPFDDPDRYLDIAVGRNISRSLDLAGRDEAGMLSSLRSSGGLSSAIRKVLKCSDRMLLPDAMAEVLRSGYPGGREDPGTKAAAGLDKEAVMGALRRIWYSLDADYAKLSGDVDDIRDLLGDLDLMVEIPEEEYRDGVWTRTPKQVTSMPGLRLAHARPMIRSLMDEVPFSGMRESMKRACSDRIDEAVCEILLTDEVLLETTRSVTDGPEVRRIRFKDGTVDMLLYDAKGDSCILVDVEYTDRRMKDQYRHIADPAKCRAIEARFGRISRRIVMYLGGPGTVDGIDYIDVEDYLKGLPGSAGRLFSSP